MSLPLAAAVAFFALTLALPSSLSLFFSLSLSHKPPCSFFLSVLSSYLLAQGDGAGASSTTKPSRRARASARTPLVRGPPATVEAELDGRSRRYSPRRCLLIEKLLLLRFLLLLLLTVARRHILQREDLGAGWRAAHRVARRRGHAAVGSARALAALWRLGIATAVAHGPLYVEREAGLNGAAGAAHVQWTLRAGGAKRVARENLGAGRETRSARRVLGQIRPTVVDALSRQRGAAELL